MPQGTIVKALSGFYYVRAEGGTVRCRARGKFRKDGLSPLVGDRVTFEAAEEGWYYSQSKRAVLVKYNGHVYAASMNGMHHGTQTIKNNNFAGHFCIHFTGSKTHGSKKVDSAHQSCIKTALKHTW